MMIKKEGFVRVGGRSISNDYSGKQEKMFWF